MRGVGGLALRAEGCGRGEGFFRWIGASLEKKLQQGGQGKSKRGLTNLAVDFAGVNQCAGGAGTEAWR